MSNFIYSCLKGKIPEDRNEFLQAIELEWGNHLARVILLQWDILNAKEIILNYEEEQAQSLSLLFEHEFQKLQLEDANKKLIAMQNEALENAHKAGMNVIIRDLLHNVGNILNSLRVSNTVIYEKTKSSAFGKKFHDANTLLKNNIDNLKEFIVNDPKGEKLLHYYIVLEEIFEEYRDMVRQENDKIDSYVRRIMEIFASEEKLISNDEFNENLNIAEIIDKILYLSENVMKKNNLQLKKELIRDVTIHASKIKIFYILSAIIKNAMEAMIADENQQNILTITMSLTNTPNKLVIFIHNTGPAIEEKMFPKIFTCGYSTKPNHKGLSLHNCANYLAEMKGRIYIQENPLKHGNTFVIELPLTK